MLFTLYVSACKLKFVVLFIFNKALLGLKKERAIPLILLSEVETSECCASESKSKGGFRRDVNASCATEDVSCDCTNGGESDSLAPDNFK